MFERFNEQGRQVVVLALDEARSLGHDQIGSEHLLLGLLRLDDDLVELFGESDDVRRRVIEIVGEGELAPDGQLPFTPNGKRALELSVAEAAGALVGPWQIALALLGLPDDATALRALRAQGVAPGDAREEILGLRRPAPEDEQPGKLSAASRRVLETAARHAEDAALGPEHLLLALVLELPALTVAAIGTADGGIVHERLAGLFDGPEPSALHAPRRDIAVLEAALRLSAGRGSEEVTPVEILLGLLEVAPDVVARAAVDLDVVADRVRQFGRRSSGVAPAEVPRALLPPSEGPPAGFSAGAHAVLACARAEAERLGHGYIGTEHLLLALVQDELGAAGRVLAELQIGLEEVRARVEHLVPPGDDSEHVAGSSAHRLPFGPRVSHIVGLAVREMAVRAGATEVDSGDLLLAIERDGEGVAVQVLEQLGAPGTLVRDRTLGVLRMDATSAAAGKPAPSARRALLLADSEAHALGHAWVGCEHLLLALARQDGPAADALATFGVTAASVLGGLSDLGASVGFGDGARTPRLVRSIETAEGLAAAAGRPQAGDADLLIALARESAGAARTLLGAAVDEAALRRALADS